MPINLVDIKLSQLKIDDSWIFSRQSDDKSDIKVVKFMCKVKNDLFSYFVMKWVFCPQASKWPLEAY